MYLISIYFDETTENKIKSIMRQIAKHTGNLEMLDGNVPPHVTISAFWTESEEKARKIFENASKVACGGKLQWVSAGSFLPGVMYISPILNEYLHELSEIYNKEVIQQENVQIDRRYEPFHWFPHTTLAKHLTKEQLRIAFEVVQNQFATFDGYVTRVGLAKTNPYRDLCIAELKKGGLKK